MITDLTIDRPERPSAPLRFTWEVSGFRWGSQDLFAVLITILIAVLVLQRLIADRREKSRLAGELEAARTVQQLLLPTSTPANIDAVYLPAAEVGGDFWHILDDRLLVVGDVSGKGLKAAMIVSLIAGALRNRRSEHPAAILAELNAILLDSPGFVTACVARLDGDTVTLANAGHPNPYLNGQELDVQPSLPLGITPDAGYMEITLSLTGPLTFLSDGVIEAAAANGELFGFDRTREISTQPAQAIADAAKAWGQNDDITVVTVRRIA
jgi:serine phosphatase RsbU (regulator of sigma subunit)